MMELKRKLRTLLENHGIYVYRVGQNDFFSYWWPKYTQREYRWRTYKERVLEQVTFSDWYSLWCNSEVNKTC